MNVVDTESGDKEIFSFQDWNQNQARFTVAGLVNSVDADANSFIDMERYSQDLKQVKIAPSTIEKTSSFVSYTKLAELLANLKRLGYQPQESRLDLTLAAFKIRDWPTAVDALAKGTVAIEGAGEK
jgi:hypothetical protein